MKNRLIFAIWLLVFLDLFAVALISTVLSSYLKQLGFSIAQVGFIGSIYGFVQIFSSPIVGCLSDIYGRKCLLLICCTLSCAGYFLLGFSKSVWLIVLARVLLGSFKHTQNLAKILASDLCESSDERIFLISWMNSLASLGMVVGPFIGGYLAAVTSFEPVLVGYSVNSVVTGVLFVGCIVVCFVFPDQTSRLSSSSESIAHRALTSVYTVFERFSKVDYRLYGDLLCSQFLFSFASLLYRSNFSLAVQERYDLDSIAVGHLTSYSGLVTTFSGFFIPALTGRRSKTFLIRSFAIGQVLVYLGFSLSTSIYHIASCMIPLAFLNALGRVIFLDVTLGQAPKAEHGLIFGVSTSFVSLARAIAPSVSGIALSFSLSGPQYVAVLLTVVGTLCVYRIRVKEVKPD